MIPHVTISPMADIRFRVCPHIHNRSRAKRHIYRNFQQHDERLHEAFELGGKNEIHQQDRDEKNHHQLVQHLAVGEELPEKAVSQSPVASASRFTFSINSGASSTS